MSQVFTTPCLIVSADHVYQDGGYLKISKNQVIEHGPLSSLRLKAGDKVHKKKGVIAPGFVNAHAHLELSTLRGKITFDGDFSDWVHQILPHKIKWTKNDYLKMSARGIKELITSGTTAIADHATFGHSLKAMEQSGIRGQCLMEVVAFHRAMAPQKLKELDKFLRGSEKKVRRGFAVHAPYSVSFPLMKQGAQLAKKLKKPMSIHLSELKEEVRFCMKPTDRNPLVSLLKFREMWDPAPQLGGKRPTAYVAQSGVLAPHTLAIHGNYLNADDRRILKQKRSVVVYCPLSHEYFGHPKHPIKTLTKEGISTAIGTDSLASNHCLDMRAEARQLQASTGWPWQKVFAAVTQHGAQALQLKAGSLEKNRWADFVIHRPLQSSNPFASILQDERPVSALFVGGQQLK